jgi:hypothetical protein
LFSAFARVLGLTVMSGHSAPQEKVAMKMIWTRRKATVRLALMIACTGGFAGRSIIACSGSHDGVDGVGDHPQGDASLDGSGPSDDTSSGQDAAPPPSYCQGLVLYASLDTGYAPELGTASAIPGDQARLVPEGRFGGGVALIADAGARNPMAAVYFAREDGGPPVYPEAEGSLAVWYNGVHINTEMPILYRPVATLPPAPLQAAGLLLMSSGAQFGLFDARDFPVLTFPTSAVGPYLRDDTFNHFVTSWRGDAGGAPTAYLTINGGLGEVVFDAGVAIPDYHDAVPTDAGELHVPYRGYTSRPWNNNASAVALRVGGPTVNAPNGIADDLALWNRVLTFDEIAALYRANTPIGQVCRLR